MHSLVYGARQLSGRMPDTQSSEPGFESPLVPFRRLGIFVISIDAPVDLSGPTMQILRYIQLPLP